MKWQNGTVRWFDNLAGYGFIRVKDKCIFVHWSAIAKGSPDAFAQPKTTWFILFKGQNVKVKICDESYTQISEVKGA